MCCENSFLLDASLWKGPPLIALYYPIHCSCKHHRFVIHCAAPPTTDNYQPSVNTCAKVCVFKCNQAKPGASCLPISLYFCLLRPCRRVSRCSLTGWRRAPGRSLGWINKALMMQPWISAVLTATILKCRGFPSWAAKQRTNKNALPLIPQYEFYHHSAGAHYCLKLKPSSSPISVETCVGGGTLTCHTHTHILICGPNPDLNHGNQHHNLNLKPIWTSTKSL